MLWDQEIILWVQIAVQEVAQAALARKNDWENCLQVVMLMVMAFWMGAYFFF